MPAIDIPPHSAFDIKVEIDAKYERTLKPYWRQRLHNDRKENAFLATVSLFRTLLLFPCLRGLIDDDPELGTELGDFNAVNAKVITAAGTTSKLWKYMSVIHNSNVMKLVRHIISQFRGQKNVFGFGRKIVFAAHKPFNIAVFNLVSCSNTGMAELNTDNLTSISNISRVSVNTRPSRLQMTSSLSTRGLAVPVL